MLIHPSIHPYTYSVIWSPEDSSHVGLCAGFSSLSWLEQTPQAALKGIQKMVCDVVADMGVSGKVIPLPKNRNTLTS